MSPLLPLCGNQGEEQELEEEDVIKKEEEQKNVPSFVPFQRCFRSCLLLSEQSSATTPSPSMAIEEKRIIIKIRRGRYHKKEEEKKHEPFLKSNLRRQLSALFLSNPRVAATDERRRTRSRRENYWIK